MDLHLITYFVAVVDRGGITKAAQSLYISQPSLSQAIRTLERRLGTTLFDRTGRRLTLTEDGRRLDVAARRILADVERAKAKVAAVRELASGRVDVVTYSSFSFDPMIELARRFRDRYPHILVRIVDTDGPAGVHTALRRGEAEIGVTDLSVEHAGMITVPLFEQELVLALHHDLAADLRTRSRAPVCGTYPSSSISATGPTPRRRAGCSPRTPPMSSSTAPTRRRRGDWCAWAPAQRWCPGRWPNSRCPR